MFEVELQDVSICTAAGTRSATAAGMYLSLCCCYGSVAQGIQGVHGWMGGGWGPLRDVQHHVQLTLSCNRTT